MKTILLLTSILASLGWGSAATAQEMVFVIRHGEKEAEGDDPPLTAAGRRRAEAWADLLKTSGIDIVLHTDAARSRETGEIIAASLDMERTEVPMTDTAGLMDLLVFDHAEDTVLVIAHTETIPGILFQLGVETPPDVKDDDFANLFLVAPVGDGAPVFVVLRMP
ncbi:SixA phosphatase family protein [Tropicimonas aquimaris]|uniref:SixA phosphatase family protein n=1 Tax=Tropicimonas aquimaris TaxID=914152 RepID=A0ABW3ITU2_9RHOB